MLPSLSGSTGNCFCKSQKAVHVFLLQSPTGTWKRMYIVIGVCWSLPENLVRMPPPSPCPWWRSLIFCPNEEPIGRKEGGPVRTVIIKTFPWNMQAFLCVSFSTKQSCRQETPRLWPLQGENQSSEKWGKETDVEIGAGREKEREEEEERALYVLKGYSSRNLYLFLKWLKERLSCPKKWGSVKAKLLLRFIYM